MCVPIVVIAALLLSQLSELRARQDYGDARELERALDFGASSSDEEEYFDERGVL